MSLCSPSAPCIEQKPSIVGGVDRISLGFSKDGRYLATAGDGHPVKVWEVATGKVWRRLEERSAGESPALFTPEGHLIATIERDKSTWIFSPDANAGSTAVGYCLGNLPWAVLSPDGKILASPGEVKHLILQDLSSRKVILKLPFPYTPPTCAFSPDGKRLFTAEHTGPIRAWDIATGQEVLKTVPLNCCYSMAVSPDGKILASGSETITLWDAANGASLRDLKHESTVLGLAFFPDGKKLASVSGGKTRIWDVAASKELHVMEGGRFNVALSPDGKIVASGGDSLQPRVWLWEAETGREIRTLDAK